MGKKYSEPKGISRENKVIEKLKGNFWDLFKNKNTNVKPSFI